MGCGSSCMAAEHPLSSKTPVGGTARRQHLVRSPAHGKSRGAVDVDRDTGTDFASTSASTGLTVSASSSARSITTTEKADPLDTTDTAVVTVTNHGHLFEIREELNEDEAESTKHSLEKNETRCTNLPATRSFFNGPGRTRGAPQVEVIQVRPATSLQLARVIRPENALQVQRLQQHYASLQSMHEVKMNTLRNLEIFVLDNSVRESTVGAVLGHSVAEKLSIMDLVMGAGIRHQLIATFHDTQHRVDDKFCRMLLSTPSLQRKYADQNLFGFAELFSKDKRGVATILVDDPPTTGLQRASVYGIRNIVFEVDAQLRTCPELVAQLNRIKSQMQQVLMARIEWARQHCGAPGSPLLNGSTGAAATTPPYYFLNIRDLVPAWDSDPDIVTSILVSLATMPPSQRISGILFEDPTGGVLPFKMAECVSRTRLLLSQHGWHDAHILVHVHNGFGLAEACVLECLASGGTGIWCGISREGAACGHANSLTTLTNLARIGNQNVINRFDFKFLRQSAIDITVLTTGQQPHPMTELYGSRALDDVFGGGMGGGCAPAEKPRRRSSPNGSAESYDSIASSSGLPPAGAAVGVDGTGTKELTMAELFDLQPLVRITTFTTPLMFGVRLSQEFGSPLDADVSDELARQLLQQGGIDGVAAGESGSFSQLPAPSPLAGGGRGISGVSALERSKEQALLWNQAVLQNMFTIINRDLLGNTREDFNHPAALLRLYERAGGVPTPRMVAIVNANNAAESHPVMGELKAYFERYLRFAKGGESTSSRASSPASSSSTPASETLPASPSHRQHMTHAPAPAAVTAATSNSRSSNMSYAQFYDCFLGRFLPDEQSDICKAFMALLDVDRDGTISFSELHLRVQWAILQHPAKACSIDSCIRVIIDRLVKPAVATALRKKKLAAVSKLAMGASSFAMKKLMAAASGGGNSSFGRRRSMSAPSLTGLIKAAAAATDAAP